ncbi:bifunctional 4-hydroxy-2-oxoglutarate aldolase/2-dehydro-3-deoxy-phosphogluconate aldolase [Bifidobacterium sp. ESL0732]|uniref:bifunctional 4-hydroxy-2-oxoglutarate aldolase/2-dehydro-3-deoxy-phosphogluconate aldolase n=1 Tax=Bifidobacterium sp. ESL0732 TaxID=2983222 RepID=UPI0023F6F386|nr:bifunctional 4-hydroxy-2-oxoglutarate aldolase/2-dehydro-3-deoxy-phosphogluconate aldolase [Bifidobacterium sp. ESL0732]WEV63914.1 bifunctional 4-hydroxy-2-oxoglutarate aldolase/2-dehydro-3-deoxy-phosphogluconate aldolase [Bifidobacterium sp. ESL0732]
MKVNEFVGQAIAILRSINVQQLPEVVDGLYESGIRFLEIASDSHISDMGNAERISTVTEMGLPGLHVGAGTVVSAEGVQQSAFAGAEFILSPDSIGEVIDMTKKLGLISIPGAFSPTEIRHAYDRGADIVKIFPAERLGTQYIKDLMAPMPGIPLCAVGGVNERNAAEFIACGSTCVGIGSSLFPKNSEGIIDIAAMKDKAATLVSSLNEE